jgi:cell wall-associated NlpC family hydrolase
MRRVAACLATLAFVLVFAQAATAASWARPQIRAAVQSGLMGPSVPNFRPNDPLTQGDLARVVAGLSGDPEQTPGNPKAVVTMTQLDRALVRALGVGAAASAFQAELRSAGVAPPRRAGWETVARLLELRINHPTGTDDLELRPNDPATRAEAAYSVARALSLDEWSLDRVNEAADTFDLPEYTDWQRRVLTRAVKFVGYPYVWGGTSENKQTLFGVTSRGGFDCSGFVWRVYKVEPYSDSPKLGTTIRNRTAAGMAGEIAKTARVGWLKLRPADVLFFGPNGRTSMPAGIDHAGIALGNGWFVHSSGQGTTVAPLAGWHEHAFAWGRRPLREAGLS